jgi:hypothetical protein
MNIAPQVTLQVLGRSVPLLIRGISSEGSLHSGRNLQILTGQIFLSSPPEQTAALAEISAVSPQAPIHGSIDGADANFEVRSSSYRQGSTSVNLVLAEADNLKCELLTIDDLDLTPYFFEETLQNGGITLTCKVTTSAAIDDRLQALLIAKDDDGYHQVIRHGIQDTPRRMRFGNCQWSSTDAGFKQHLILVEDAAELHLDYHPFAEFGNLYRSGALSMEFVEALVAEMVGAGIISEEILGRARATAEANLPHRLRALSRVEDIDTS